MNEIQKNYSELLKNIEDKQNEIKKMLFESNELKKFIEIANNIKKLKRLKRNIEPLYLENVMQKCNHLFIKTSYKHTEWSESDRYILFINHYCLKCGCTTKILDKNYLKKRGVNFIPSFVVNHNKQIEIIENSRNYQVIDCGNTCLYELVVAWENIKQQNIKFDEQVRLFLKINLKNTKKEIFKKEAKVYEFKYLR